MIRRSPISMSNVEYWTISFLKAPFLCSSFLSRSQVILSAPEKRSESGLSYSTRRTLMLDMFSL